MKMNILKAQIFNTFAHVFFVFFLCSSHNLKDFEQGWSIRIAKHIMIVDVKCIGSHAKLFVFLENIAFSKCFLRDWYFAGCLQNCLSGKSCTFLLWKIICRVWEKPIGILIVCHMHVMLFVIFSSCLGNFLWFLFAYRAELLIMSKTENVYQSFNLWQNSVINLQDAVRIL